jgi:hypothetical protein
MSTSKAATVYSISLFDIIVTCRNVVNVEHDQPLWRWNSPVKLEGLKEKWGNVISKIGEPNF